MTPWECKCADCDDDQSGVCLCGHEGFMHSDIDLYHLGDCYVCDCEGFR